MDRDRPVRVDRFAAGVVYHHAMQVLAQTLLALAVASAAAAPDVPLSRPGAKRPRTAQMKRRRKKIKAPRGPLSGADKKAAVQTIASKTGSAALQAKTVLQVGLAELSDRVGLDVEGTVFRARGESGPLTMRTSRVGMMIPARPGGVYMFDCGVTSGRTYRFNVFENGGGVFASGTASVTDDRLVFAHAFSRDADAFLLVNFVPASGTTPFTFSSCEVTELAPAQPQAKQVRSPTAGTVAQ